MKASLSLFILATVCGGGSSDCGLEHQGSSAGRDRRNIVLRGDDEYNMPPITRYLTQDQIKQLNEVDSLDEMKKILLNKTIQSRKTRSFRNFTSPKEMLPKSSKCKPMLQPVRVKRPDDPTVMYWPYCVELEQCSGCCFNDRQHSCQPTKTERVSVNDCHPLQDYNPESCQCKCRNIDEKGKCLSDPNRVWDKNQCSCRCR